MHWWTGFAGKMECDAPLASHTWFRLGGRARFLFHPQDAEDLAALIRRSSEEDLPVKILGAGANVLVSDDGFDGVVVRLDAAPFREVKQRAAAGGGGAHALEVGAGVDLMPLARRCSQRGLSGLECMAGIPGTVGGAVRMNAGGRFGSFGDVVREVRVLEASGDLNTLTRSQLDFGYRHCRLDERILLSAALELREEDPDNVLRTFNRNLEYKTQTQPLADHSAGCVFKNPQGQSAGALIDRAGLKGTRYGQARVCDQHANFIVADHGATASDVLHLIDVVRDRVREVFNLALETEIDIWKPHGVGC